jgi:general secretion pathway protein F/type IV pilus assembly protein PilC
MKELLMDRNLHPLTQGILSISEFLESHANIMAFTFLGAILVLLLFLQSRQGRQYIQKISLKIPILKKFITETVLVRFTQTLSVLLAGGVPVVNALKYAKKVMNHCEFEQAVTQAEKGLIEGKKLSEELKKSGIFPNIMVRMLQISDETGNTPEMLKNISRMYEDNLDKTLNRITALIQPVLLLVLGIVVGIILLAVLLPLTDVSSFIN